MMNVRMTRFTDEIKNKTDRLTFIPLSQDAPNMIVKSKLLHT
jgi:hypothetical protein